MGLVNVLRGIFAPTGIILVFYVPPDFTALVEAMFNQSNVLKELSTCISGKKIALIALWVESAIVTVCSYQ